MQFGGNSAQLLYILSELTEISSSPVEALCTTIGEAGKAHLLANVPKESEQYSYLRANHFQTYSVQSLWKVKAKHHSLLETKYEWELEKEEDRSIIRFFYTRFISPLEASIRTWNFSDTFHFLLWDANRSPLGIARVRFYPDRAVIMPIFDNTFSQVDSALTALFMEISQYFSTFFIRIPTSASDCHVFLQKYADLVLPEDHFMVRNLAAVNAIKNFHPTELMDDKSIAKPTTPFSRNGS